MGAANKCLAQGNKSGTGIKATKGCSAIECGREKNNPWITIELPRRTLERVVSAESLVELERAGAPGDVGEHLLRRAECQVGNACDYVSTDQVSDNRRKTRGAAECVLGSNAVVQGRVVL